MQTTVIHHSADYDGIFCREIARKFLPEAELIGWDFPDKPLAIPEGQIYVLDLPVDRVFGFDFSKEETLRRFGAVQLVEFKRNLIWIDHHKSSIETHPKDIPGYRIDGVSACRMAWQWFRFAQPNAERAIPCCGYKSPPTLPWAFMWNEFNGVCQCHNCGSQLPSKQEYADRKVSEPMAVRLAGEYDVWDHRGDGDLEFQFGLDCLPESYIATMLGSDVTAENTTAHAVSMGKAAMACYAKRDADVLRKRSFLIGFEGLKFLALNTARCNSNTFNALDVPATGHDALMAFAFDGRQWNFSLYHASHRKDIDLSEIAKRHGGGGHRGACGFMANQLPFLK